MLTTDKVTELNNNVTEATDNTNTMNAEIEYQISVEDFLEYLHQKHKLKGTELDAAMCFILTPKIIDDFIIVKVLYDTDIAPSQWPVLESILDRWENPEK